MDSIAPHSARRREMVGLGKGAGKLRLESVDSRDILGASAKVSREYHITMLFLQTRPRTIGHLL
jgi:hypothetical protein